MSLLAIRFSGLDVMAFLTVLIIFAVLGMLAVLVFCA